MSRVPAYRHDSKDLARGEDDEFPLHSDNTGVGMDCGFHTRQQLI